MDPITFKELTELVKWARENGVTSFEIPRGYAGVFISMTLGPPPPSLVSGPPIARDPRTPEEIEDDLLFASSPGYYSHAQRHADESQK